VSFGSDWDTRKKISMSERLGNVTKLKSLVETACVHVEQREFIAWCKIFLRIKKAPKKLSFEEFLETIIIPSFKELGHAKWYRDIITDLGLALSLKKREAQSEDTGDILEKEIE